MIGNDHPSRSAFNEVHPSRSLFNKEHPFRPPFIMTSQRCRGLEHGPFISLQRGTKSGHWRASYHFDNLLW
ncbi:hypothetical protein COCNU_04G005520 [Cocos nucifera]|uniref:Uncharacterized protein n=1 Tax=Cocos nucifera TaxID=13894 RepID=A0A8K0I5J9_COCNU|nr:hypothetical protein COCNU_04G005520 [Cocos nucifera]